MKIWILYLLKFTGFFILCRRFVANKTLLLAYHGFEIDDETGFRSQLFIKADTFNRRMVYIKKHCHVIALNELENQLQQKNKVAITIDDGWYSTLSVGAPVLKRHSLPYTVYLTTENVLDNQPIYHVALSYILHKNLGKRLQFDNGSNLSLDIVITSDNIADIVEQTQMAKQEKNDTQLLMKIAKALDYDFDRTIDNRALTLMSAEQVVQLQALGADIQLHTHTHNTPLDSFEEFAKEINVNRDCIEEITGKTPEHHCYPSGVYNQSSFGYLKRLDVKTATTCYAGFYDGETNPMEIPRFLDSEHIPQIVFEAEVCGVLEVMRGLFKGKVKTLLSNVLRAPRRFA